MFTSILMLGLFLGIIVLMINRKLPTLLALPILAVTMAIIAGVPLDDAGTGDDMGILNYVIQQGAVRLAPTYCAVIFSACLGQFMNQTGVSKRIIRGAAELGGDNPFFITLLTTTAVAMLFTTLDGLGAVIMAATIAIPMMTSVRVPGLVAACMMLFGMATGGIMNVSNWAFYTNVTGVPQSDVQSFAIGLAFLTATFGLLFAIIEFKRMGLTFSWATYLPVPSPFPTEINKIPLVSLFTPLVPIICVILLKWPVLPAFIAGMGWCFLSIYFFSPKKIGELITILTKAAFEAISDSTLAVLLMIGIGMVLNSFMHPVVAKNITPFLQAVIPSERLTYILFFSLLAPLALYRGPLNLWGLGSGIATVMIGLKILPAPAVFSAFLSAERVQCIGDPTNTHNVWLSNYI